MINLATLGEVKREQDSMRVKENITGMHTGKKTVFIRISAQPRISAHPLLLPIKLK